MQDLITVVLPVFLVLGFGYLASWRAWISDVQIDGLMNFAVNFAVPSLLFLALANLELSEDMEPALFASFYSGAIVCFCVGVFGARYLFGRDWEDCIAIGFSCFFSNTVMLGLPIAERAYGSDQLAGNFAIISVHALFCYGIGITAMELVKARGQARLSLVKTVFLGIFKNALILAIIAGLLVNLSGFALPEPVETGLSILARAALPVALFAIGGVLYRYKPEGDLRAIAFVCAVSLILHPATTFLVGTATQLSTANLRSAVLTASVAPGINTYLFASMYQRATRVAASGVLFGTAASIFTISLWLIALP
jgi:predicted permease